MSLASQKGLRDLLASCTAFQTMVGALDADEAKERIALYSATPPLEAPCAMVFDINDEREQLAAGHFYYSGEMGLEIELPRPDPTPPATEYETARELWETLQVELQNKSLQPGGLSIGTITVQDMEDTADSRKSQRWFVQASITWPGDV